MLKADIDKQAVKKVYGRWAPIYDLVFGAIFERGRRAAIAASERIGGRILEVGVGTGISLAYYSHKSRVVGIDLSEQMLRRARQRVVERSLRNVEGLAVMDAERLDFPDASFDVVVAQCVVNRFYHHSRINQTLHLLSATSFLCTYVLIFTNPALAVLLAWLFGMTSRQIGHFFFEPRDYDEVEGARDAELADQQEIIVRRCALPIPRLQVEDRSTQRELRANWGNAPQGLR